jgi:hypothetical protein
VSHHLDSPASRRDPRLNVTDVYAFDGNDATVLTMIVNSSLAGAGRPAGFHPEGRYEFKIWRSPTATRSRCSNCPGQWKAVDDATDTDRLPLTKRLDRSFAARIGDLDATTRTALNLAALNDSGDIAATELLAGTATPAVFDPATSAGLISVEGTAVRFEHPLIRSSIYQRLSPTTQQAGHNARAWVLHGSPERALWHWAAAALQPDSALAAGLEQSADRSRRWRRTWRMAPGTAWPVRPLPHGRQ